MGRLTTHVLDTARGCPAEGIAVTLWGFGADGVQRPDPLARAVTNADGRVDAPLLDGEAFAAGSYMIEFAYGAYMDATGQAPRGGDPKFLDQIVIRFGVASADQHYHVPLLVSPYGYSTYRGS